MIDVYQFNDYKSFVLKALEEKGHGSRLKLAEALKCHSAYITQVVAKDAHLSLEQAIEAATFFNLHQEEEDFFLLLVQLGRAGTKKLQDSFSKKIADIREKRALVSNRLSHKAELDEATQGRYYSRWYYAAIHVLVTIPKKNNKEAMAQYLGLDMNVLNEAIEFLESAGLIVLNEDGYGTGLTKTFLKGDSPFIVQHHENWRLRAIESFTSVKKENLHFSSVYTLSENDFVKIREILLGSIQNVWDIVRPSPEEKVAVLNVDFFELRK